MAPGLGQEISGIALVTEMTSTVCFFSFVTKDDGKFHIFFAIETSETKDYKAKCDAFYFLFF